MIQEEMMVKAFLMEDLLAILLSGEEPFRQFR